MAGSVPAPQEELNALFGVNNEPSLRPKVTTYRRVEDGNNVIIASADYLSPPPLRPDRPTPVPEIGRLFAVMTVGDSKVILHNLSLLRVHLRAGTRYTLTGKNVSDLLTLIAGKNEPSVQVEAVSVLLIMLYHQEHRKIAIEQGASRILIKQLSSNDNEVLERVVSGFIQIAAGGPKDCDRLDSNGIVDALVQFTERDDVYDLLLTTIPTLLSRIWSVYNSAMKCREFNKSLPVVKALLHKSDTVIAATCRSLAYISPALDKPSVEQMRKKEILPRLLDLLSTTSDYEIIHSITVVMNCIVSQHACNARDVVQCGGLDAFARLLQDGEFEVHTSMLLDTISNIVAHHDVLSATVPVMQKVVDSGLIPLVLENIHGRHIRAATACVMNLTCAATEAHLQLLDDNDLLIRLQYALNQRDHVEPSTLVCGLRAFTNVLSIHETLNSAKDFWDRLDFLGAVATIRELESFKKSREVRRLASKLVFLYLYTMGSGLGMQQTVPKLENLVTGLDLEVSDHVYDHIRMIAYIVCDRTLLDHHDISRFIELGGVRRLVQLLNPRGEARIQRESIRTLVTIMEGTDEQKMAVVEEGAGKMLILLLAPGSILAREAAHALTNLAASGNAQRDMLLKQNILPSLLHVIDNPLGISTSALEYVAACVSNLFCYYNDPLPADVVVKCLPEIYQLLMNDSSKIVLHACTAIENITYGENHYENDLESQKITERLVELVYSSGHSKQINSALKVIGRISAQYAESLHSMHVLPALKRVLVEQEKLGTDDALVAWCLSNIAKHPILAVDIVNKEFLPLLINLLQKSSSVEAKRKAVLVVHNMTQRRNEDAKEQLDHVATLVHNRALIDALVNILGGYNDRPLAMITMATFLHIFRAEARLGTHQELWKHLEESKFPKHLDHLQYQKDEMLSEMAKTVKKDFWDLNRRRQW